MFERINVWMDVCIRLSIEILQHTHTHISPRKSIDVICVYRANDVSTFLVNYDSSIRNVTSHGKVGLFEIPINVCMRVRAYMFSDRCVRLRKGEIVRLRTNNESGSHR